MLVNSPSKDRREQGDRPALALSAAGRRLRRHLRHSSTWSRQQIAGGAVLALFGHILEDVPTPVDMSLSRLTADLFRAVPLGEVLKISSTVLRAGKRIQVVEMTLSVGDKEFARARALRLRDEDVPPSARLARLDDRRRPGGRSAVAR